MNTAIVMLGSNVNQEQNLILAKEKLSEFFEILDESSILITKPVGKKYNTDFHNQAIKIYRTTRLKKPPCILNR